LASKLAESSGSWDKGKILLVLFLSRQRKIWGAASSKNQTLGGYTIVFVMDCCDCLLLILAIFLSPLAVLIKVGCCVHFWINVILFILGVIPGIIHAWWVICTKHRHHHH